MKMCVTVDECESGEKCMEVSMMGGMYCVPGKLSFSWYLNFHLRNSTSVEIRASLETWCLYLTDLAIYGAGNSGLQGHTDFC